MASAAERAAELLWATANIMGDPDEMVAALMADPDLLGALAIEAGWVPPNVTTADLSYIQEVAARLDDFDD